MKVVAEYKYNDEQGNELFYRVRYLKDDGSKDFKYFHTVNGVTVSGIDGCRRVIYKMPEVIRAIRKGVPIILVEGEKDVETLLKNKIYMPSTSHSTPHWADEYTDLLRDANVYILYDNDRAGLRRRDLLIEKLFGNVKTLRVVDLPGIEYSENSGKDISDWLEIEGNTPALFKELMNKTNLYEKPLPVGPYSVINTEDLFDFNVPKRGMIIQPFLPEQGLAMLFAQRGVGKTHIAIGIAYAVASGGCFLKWDAPQPRKVIYLDGEMAASDIRDRFRMAHDMSETKVLPGYLKIMTQDLQNCPMPDLSTLEGRDSLEPYIDDRELIILDNLSCLFRSGDESDSASWHDAQAWLLDLKRRGKSVLVIHHAGKSGAQRGTSKREDMLDTVIELRHPDDYDPQDGARFIVSYPKARGFRGVQAKSFEAQLSHDNDGPFWTINSDTQKPEDSSNQDYIKKLKELKASGHTLLSIAEKEGISKTQVHRLLSRE